MRLSASKRLWGRRWFRRITYVLISGAAVTGAGLWTVRQPFFNRWLVSKLDALLREETGLGLQAESLDFRLFQGRVVLHRFSLGEDLLRADRLEVQADFSSFLGRNPHVWNIELENPTSVLDARRLARIQLKPRPSQGAPPQVRLDRFTVLGGKLLIQEPAWRLPNAEFTYRVYGQGLGPNRVMVDLRVPQLRLGSGSEAVAGSLQAKANLSDLALELKEGELRLGSNHVSAKGNYAFDARMLAAQLRGQVDLAESLRWVDPKASPRFEGSAEFEAGVQGLLADPAWNLKVKGQGLSAQGSGLKPGDLLLSAHGGLHQAILEKLDWSSIQGRLQATGDWKQGTGSHLRFEGRQLGLAPLASYLRVGFLENLGLDVEGEADLPGEPWIPPRLDAMKVRAEGRFIRSDATVGQVTADLSGGLLELTSLSLQLPEVTLDGSGTLRFGKRDLQSLSAQAKVGTEASLVADVLERWEIGEGTSESGEVVRLGMAGKASAEAEVRWDGGSGTRLQGRIELENPRWHGASMDHLRAEIGIHDDELRVQNLRGEKGPGSAEGSLWLTWRSLPAGQDEIDMCFQAFNLPIEEGLKAADVGDLPITGLGSGWGRIHGTYNRLWLEAGATARGLDVYGLKIPSGSGDLLYDIAGDRMVVKDARIAETAEQLGSPDEDPSGLLALRGAMDMDLKRETWQVSARGSLDSKPLGLPGPRFQAKVDTRFEGPWVGDFGGLALPLGTCTFMARPRLPRAAEP